MFSSWFLRRDVCKVLEYLHITFCSFSFKTTWKYPFPLLKHYFCLVSVHLQVSNKSYILSYNQYQKFTTFKCNNCECSFSRFFFYLAWFLIVQFLSNGTKNNIYLANKLILYNLSSFLLYKSMTKY